MCKNVHFTNDKEEDTDGLAQIKISKHFGMGKLKFNLTKISRSTVIGN